MSLTRNLILILLLGILGYLVFVTKVTRPTVPPAIPPPVNPNPINQINSLRSVASSPGLAGALGVELELYSSKKFPVRNELAVLRIGEQEFLLSRYPESGDLHTLIFALTLEEYAKIRTGQRVLVYYGRGRDAVPSKERWDFGSLDTSLLDRPKSTL